MSRRPELAVVVVTWNSLPTLEACLGALPPAAGEVPFEVTVVDNASTDGTAERVREMIREGRPGLRLIANQANRGFGAGAHQGVEARRDTAGDPSPWVAVVNPDLVAPPGSLEALAQFLRDHPRAGLVGPSIETPAGEPLAGGAESLPGLASALADVPLLGRWYRRRAERRRKVSSPTRCGRVRGACLVFRRSALEDIGGFPRDTFLYGEEILLGHRLAQHGHEIWYLPTVRVVHEHGASTAQRWSDTEIALERRRVRIRVMHEILARPSWLLWNLLSWGGLTLQGLGARLSGRAPGERVAGSKKLHRRALASGRPVREGAFG